MSGFNTEKLINSLADVYSKLPVLPKGAKDFIVVITPWISLIFGALIILASLSAFGLTAVVSPIAALSSGTNFAAALMLTAVLGIAEGVLMLVAFPPLRKGQSRGWVLLFWSEAVSLVSAVVGFSVTGVIGVLIGFYFLFQIRSYYK
jgi:hypothetical protein